MRRFKQQFIVAAGFVGLALAGTLFPKPVVADPSKTTPVEIVSPVPVPVALPTGSVVNTNIASSVPLTVMPTFTAPATPFQTEIFITINDGTTGNLASWDVPAGKRFVLEQVGGTIFLNSGQLRVANIRTDFGFASFGLVGNKVPDQSDNVYVINQAMRLYADTNVEFSVSRAPASTGSALCALAISGYLVDK